jgi:hypothetical protein
MAALRNWRALHRLVARFGVAGIERGAAFRGLREQRVRFSVSMPCSSEPLSAKMMLCALV